MRKKDGEYLPVLSRGLVLEWDSAGRPCRVAGIHSVLSPQPAPKPELHQTQRTALLGLLAGSIVNELNNLLTVVAGHQQLAAANPQVPTDVRESLHLIGETGERAARLIRPLLSFAHPELQHLGIIDLHQVITDFAPVIRSLLAPRIELTVHLSSQSSRVRANAGLIQQLVLNLVLTARDSMPQGGSLKIVTTSVTLVNGIGAPGTQLPGGEYLLLMVHDTGSGIEEAQSASILAPPALDAATHAILQRLNGAVSIQRQPGRGTVACLYLPLQETSQPAAGTQPTGSSGKKRILVFDEPAFLDVLTETLSGGGFEVLNAQSGKQALDTLLQQPVDLLITDLVMPSMEGIELIMASRRHVPSLPILAISGASGAVYLEIARTLGAQAALSKPFYPPQLLDKVRQLLEDRGDR